MAAARRPKVDRRDPTTLPVVAEVREEMETLPNTIRRDNKGDGKMKKSLTDRLIDLYKAAGDISFTTPSKGRGAAGMGGGSRQATSAGATSSGRTDRGWGWAKGGLIRKKYDGGGIIGLL